jgi:hypothetical protein
MLAVRRLAAGDVPALAAIVSSLPDYFTEDVAGQVERDCAVHPGWVLAGAAGITGFAVAARRSPAAAEILWIAVGPAWRGFVQVDMIDPLPGWEPGNPAAIYVAALRPTR